MAEKKDEDQLKTRRLKKLTRVFWVMFILVFGGVPAYIWSVSANLGNLYGELPSYSQLENPEQNLSSILYSADGVQLGSYFRNDRNPVTYDELGENLINALVATEDIRFEKHSGIDLGSMFRAAFGVITFNSRGGGSTVTQQLAKQLFDTRVSRPEESGSLQGINGKLDQLIYKTKEWILAVRIERSYTKEEIMAMYFNQVEFGSNTYGIQSAAKTFFNKKPNELNVEEAAVLVGLQKAVTAFNPYYNPKDSKSRRNVVMNQMAKYGFLDREVYDSLKVEDIVLDYRVQNQNQGLAQYFRAEIAKDLRALGSEYDFDLYADGIKIYTTIDSRMQAHAEAAMDTAMSALQAKFLRLLRDPKDSTKLKEPWLDDDGRIIPDFIEDNALPRTERYKSLKRKYGDDKDSIDYYLNKPIQMKIFSWAGEIDTLMSPMDSLIYYKHFLQSGFTAIDPHNGEIKAWVGGINYKYFKYDHVRQGKRQPGSLFKPLVYAKAVENNYSPCHPFMDQAVVIQLPNRDTWSPQNSDGKFSGEMMTMEHALATSTNSVSARLIDIIKPTNAADMVQRLGVQSRIRPFHSMVLGTQEVSLNEIVSAYGTFVNQGVHIEPHYVSRIEDRFGNVIYSKVPQKKTAISKDVAYVMLDMLMGAADPGRPRGFGGRLRWTYGLIDPADSMEMGGKTGTTQNASDGWFMGVTKDLVAGAWVGGDDRAIHFESWPEGQGSRTALPIVGGFFQRVYEDTLLNLKRGPFIKPEGFSREIDCDLFKVNNPQDTVSTDTIRDEDIF